MVVVGQSYQKAIHICKYMRRSIQGELCISNILIYFPCDHVWPLQMTQLLFQQVHFHGNLQQEEVLHRTS